MSKKSSNNKLSMDILQKYKEEPLFDVPDQYFEQMQHGVMQRVTKDIKQGTATKKWLSAVSFAASFAIIVILSVYLLINRNTNQPFYVQEEIIQSEDSVLTYDNYLAEATDLIVEDTLDTTPIPESLSYKTPLVTETIAYLAVDFYVDDFTIDNFFEIMYDLECYYDY